jgi:hypothetical protein
MAWIMDLLGAPVTRRAPLVVLHDNAIKDEKKQLYLPFPFEPTLRGYAVPREHIPKHLYISSKSKTYPGIFSVGSIYLACTGAVREFIEKNAPNDCFFLQRGS